jgi:hypothetical protein
VGLTWAASERSALLRLLWHRADLAVTGTRPIARRHVPPERTAQLDALWGLWQPLSWADMLRSAELGARHCRLALRSGDARHLGLALCAEALLQALSDPASTEPARLLERAELAQKSVQEPDLAAFHAFAAGTVALFQSDLPRADHRLNQAELLYARDCPGEAWQLVNVRGALLNMWMNRGDFQLGAERAESWLLDARARGDTFAFATYAVTGYGACRWIMQGDLPSALAEVDAAMIPWESPHFGIQHFGAAALRHVLLSYGSGQEPYDYWRRSWPGIKPAFLARAGFVRDILTAMRGEAALRAGVAQRGAGRTKCLSEARALFALLERSTNRLAQACFFSLEAQVELMQGRRALALDMAKRAMGMWRLVGNLSSQPCAVLLAHLEGPAERASEVTEQVVEWFGARGWREPRRALELWLPSLPFLEGRA